jgi:hypothetical protein
LRKTKMLMEIKAIITGDLVASSHYPQATKDFILKKIKDLFEAFNGKMEVYRGDSFQGFLEYPEEALDLALKVRIMLKLIKSATKNTSLDCRIAIGIGAIDHLPDKIMEGDGPAYRNSGPFLDKMRKEDRMIFMTPWEEINLELNTENKLAEAIIGRWTYSQAEVINIALTGKSQIKIAKELKISQSAVNQRLKAASWDAVNVFRGRFRQLLSTRLIN